MSLENFFNPDSVAIVGASEKKGKVGAEILANMIEAGYKGKIFPVNRKAETINGLKCYRISNLSPKYLTQIAKQRGVKRFYAQVLPGNKPMLAIVHNSGYKVKTEYDGEVYSVTYDLMKEEK